MLARHRIIEDRKEWLETGNNAKMKDSMRKQKEEQEFKAIQAKHNQDKIKQMDADDIMAKQVEEKKELPLLKLQHDKYKKEVGEMEDAGEAHLAVFGIRIPLVEKAA